MIRELLDGVRGIFCALEGRPLTTPRNAWIWWRRHRQTVMDAQQGKGGWEVWCGHRPKGWRP